MITIIAIGKKHESWIVDGLERYEKRCKQPFNIIWNLLPHSSLEGIKARKEESERILSRTRPEDFVLLLDETGKNMSNSEITSLLNQCFSTAKPVTIVIGGAYGVDDRLHQRANQVWSLSKLVFPHQLVRLMLVEQLYRSQEILSGGKYHHV